MTLYLITAELTSTVEATDRSQAERYAQSRLRNTLGAEWKEQGLRAVKVTDEMMAAIE